MLRVLSIAQQEALTAARFYEAQRRELGVMFVDAYQSALQAIDHNPLQYGLWPAWQRPGREIRRAILHRFPYVLLYVILGEDVLVLATAHMKRKPIALVSQIRQRF